MLIENYNKISTIFNDRFVVNKCEPKVKVFWPKGFGVYVVWEINDYVDKLIYVGLTGKFKKTVSNGYAINSGRFVNRKNRWTPYFFQESNAENTEFTFRYGPKYSNSVIQRKMMFESDAYEKSINYSRLRVDFFLFSEDVQNNFGYTPALLEAQILTWYLIENKSLPPANFEI